MRSHNKDVKPEPVPPPTECKIRNPSKLSHFSISLLISQSVLSTMSLPQQYLAFANTAASSLPLIN